MTITYIKHCPLASKHPNSIILCNNYVLGQSAGFMTEYNVFKGQVAARFQQRDRPKRHQFLRMFIHFLLGQKLIIKGFGNFVSELGLQSNLITKRPTFVDIHVA